MYVYLIMPKSHGSGLLSLALKTEISLEIDLKSGGFIPRTTRLDTTLSCAASYSIVLFLSHLCPKWHQSTLPAIMCRSTLNQVRRTNTLPSYEAVRLTRGADFKHCTRAAAPPVRDASASPSVHKSLCSIMAGSWRASFKRG